MRILSSFRRLWLSWVASTAVTRVMSQIEGVSGVTAEPQVVLDVNVDLKDFGDRRKRDDIYSAERFLMREFPSVHFDFTVWDRREEQKDAR